jgi:SRSO17 transposase
MDVPLPLDSVLSTTLSTSSSQQQLTTTEPQHPLSYSLTQQRQSRSYIRPTVSRPVCPGIKTHQILMLISWHGTHRKHHLSVVLYGPLPRNGRCIVENFVIVATNGSTCQSTNRMYYNPRIHRCKIISEYAHLLNNK